MINAYKYSVKKIPEQEWKFRSHLIIDFISGMTDFHAKDIYQNVKGINL